jgi:hypothetical protein
VCRARKNLLWESRLRIFWKPLLSQIKIGRDTLDLTSGLATPVNGTGIVTGPSERWKSEIVGTQANHRRNLERDLPAGANVLKLPEKFDPSFYLTGDSDIVGHLVLAHQTQMHNLITLTRAFAGGEG